MGRIEKGGEVLVDLPETMRLLGKSRATVFRMMSRGLLVRIDVVGTRVTYVTLGSIERVKQAERPDGSVSAADVFYEEADIKAKSRKTELIHRHPDLFQVSLMSMSSRLSE